MKVMLKGVVVGGVVGVVRGVVSSGGAAVSMSSFSKNESVPCTSAWSYTKGTFVIAFFIPKHLKSRNVLAKYLMPSSSQSLPWVTRFVNCHHSGSWPVPLHFCIPSHLCRTHSWRPIKSAGRAESGVSSTTELRHLSRLHVHAIIL